MAKILLIEPHRILQQAIHLSLFSEHEVKVEEKVPGSVNDYELLIVDAAALRDTGQWGPEAVRTLQSSGVPTLWLEEGDSERPPKHEKLLVVKKPIEREAFQAAVAGLLSPKGVLGERNGAATAVASRVASSRGAQERKSGERPQQEAFQFIELVDVVEEGPPAPKRRGSRRSK